MTDPIADYLTRIRNALHAGHKSVNIPSSRLKKEISKILKEENFIQDYSIVENDNREMIQIKLRYHDGEGVIKGLERISRPGLRKYADADSLPRVLNGLGIAVMSTSKGVMTDKDASKKRTGGEVICYIW